MAKETSNDGMLYKQDATIDGKTIPQWSEEWLKWIAHAPASTPPGTPLGVAKGEGQASPDYASVDNNGDVFFLNGGNWGDSGNPPVIDVPAHKPILLPMINFIDIEGPTIQQTIADFFPYRGSYADEARFVAGLAEKCIYDAHLTITKVGQDKPLLEVYSPASSFEQDTGLFALGAPQTNDYIGSIVGTDLSLEDLPNSADVGRWAMIKGLAPGDYVVNFGGAGHAVVDPVSGNTVYSSDGPNGDWVYNTTDKLHVS